MPRLELYNNGESATVYSHREISFHQLYWGGLRFKFTEGKILVAESLVLLEMHKHILLERNTEH